MNNNLAHEEVVKPVLYRCDVCQTCHASKKAFSAHMNRFHVKKLFDWTHCGIAFTTERDMKNHQTADSTATI